MGLQYAAEYVRCGSKVSVLKVAPEVRLLGAMPNPSADMFSFGHLLEELLVDRRNDWTGTDSSSKGTTQKEPISPNLFNVFITQSIIILHACMRQIFWLYTVHAVQV